MRILALYLKDLIFSAAKYSLAQKFRSRRKSAYWHSWADACYRWGCYYQRNSGTSCWSFTKRRKFKNCHELSEILGQSKSSLCWRSFVTLQRPTTLRTLPPKNVLILTFFNFLIIKLGISKTRHQHGSWGLFKWQRKWVGWDQLWRKTVLSFVKKFILFIVWVSCNIPLL